MTMDGTDMERKMLSVADHTSKIATLAGTLKSWADSAQTMSTLRDRITELLTSSKRVKTTATMAFFNTSGGRFEIEITDLDDRVMMDAMLTLALKITDARLQQRLTQVTAHAKKLSEATTTASE